MCVPFMRQVAKLWQAEVCRINSDREFFRLMRYYYDQHTRRPWARFRKIEGINFVKVRDITRTFRHAHPLILCFLAAVCSSSNP